MDRITLYYTDSYCNGSSRSLLRQAASLYTGDPLSDFFVCGDVGEKPYFQNHTNVHFSISHSDNLWAVAFANTEVGLDVQVFDHKRNCEKIAKRFFCENEAKRVLSSAEQTETFTKIWSRKEAVVKLFGIGIDSRFKAFDSTAASFEFSGSDVFVKDVSTFEHFACAVAYGTDFEIEIIKI